MKHGSLRVGIDLSVVRINQAGTAIYAESLVRALRELNSGDEYLDFAVNQQRDMSKPKTLRTRTDTLYRDLLWTHWVLPLQVCRAKVDLLHMPANIIPLSPPCPSVVTILDTRILQSVKDFPVWQRNYARYMIPYAARHATRILTISAHSRADIVKHLRVPGEKVTVTQLAPSPRFQPLSTIDVSATKNKFSLNSFILTVGTLEPRKNIVRLLQAYAKCRSDGVNIPLVHVGPRGWCNDEVMSELTRLRLEPHVRFLGRLSLGDLVGLYNAAALFVYPSLYEGFGLPVLEAMACGCPVITSNTSSLVEVAGNAALLVDPTDVQQLAEAIQRLVGDHLLAMDLRQSGLSHAAQFSWRRCAAETLEVYRKVAES